MNITDPLERRVAEAFDRAGIRYTHESQRKHKHGSAGVDKGTPCLDFYLPEWDLHVEVKAFYSERVHKQLEGKKVILLQGQGAVEWFCRMVEEGHDS